MAHTDIRKNESLVTDAARLRIEMKTSQSKYNDFVADLALLTKSELKPLVNSMDNKAAINGKAKEINELLEKIEEVLYDMDENHQEMKEVVQTIGGLEFSTSNVVDKLSEILNEQERYQSRMSTELNHLKNSLELIDKDDSYNLSDFKEDVNEYHVAFSMFQDSVIESVPRVSRLFDELDHEQAAGIRYGSTGKI